MRVYHNKVSGCSNGITLYDDVEEFKKEALKTFPLFNPVEGIFDCEKSLKLYQEYVEKIFTWLVNTFKIDMKNKKFGD